MEIFKDVKGYEGLYQVSNYGRLISLGNGESTNGNTKKQREITCNNKKQRYCRIKLFKNGVRKYYSIHRLVAIAFIPNPNKLPQVNHINGIRNDNRVENLEWCTAQHNIQHSFDIGLAVAKKGKDSPCSIPVLRISKDGEITEYAGIKEACRINGFNSFGIIKCCKKEKRYKTAYGYQWQYKDSYVPQQ
jgi:hypothetical protein